MSEPMVTVVQEQKVVGWPDEPGMRPRAKDRAYVLPLSNALTRSYTTDAHFAAYRSPNGRRLKSAAAGEVDVTIDVLVLDVDCEEAHGTGQPAPPEWRVGIRQKMLALRAAHPGFFYFETRGGSRVIYKQPITTVIASREDALQWRQDYATTVAYLDRVFGIKADPACADWTRLFRLPHATRKAGAGPESWPTSGDPTRIEPLWFTPSDEDLELAKELLPKAFNEHSKRTVSYAPHVGDGLGLLYRLLRNRGYVIREYKGGSYLIRCPNDASHTGGKTGDSSTVLYPPGPGESLGHIHCLHAHCQSLQARDWLRLFSASEIEAADPSRKRTA